MARPTPIVIDTDIGADPDDAMALAFAAASPEVDILGVTVVDGDVDLRARMAARILGMAGRADVPVFVGESQPIGSGRGPTMLGFEGRGLLDLPYSGPEAQIEATPAGTWLSRQARSQPYHLIAIGPLTNIARALESDSGLVRHLTGLTIMGGVLDVTSLSPAVQNDIRERGIHAAWPDHNTASDPEAALLCARSGIPVTWITSEITFDVPLHPSTLRSLPTQHPLTEALRGMTTSWHAWWSRHAVVRASEEEPESTSTFMHDPLTIASLFSKWVTLDRIPLRYSIEEGVFRLRPAPEPEADANASVSVSVNGQLFEREFLDRLTRHLRT